MPNTHKSSKDTCAWCGKTYDEHEIDYPNRHMPRVPCGLLKGGFSARPHTPKDEQVSEQWCKCERCGRIRKLFQYTKFEVKNVETVIDNGHSARPRYTTKHEDIGEKRGYCEECAVEVNKQEHDTTQTQAAYERGVQDEKTRIRKVIEGMKIECADTASARISNKTLDQLIKNICA